MTVLVNSVYETSIKYYGWGIENILTTRSEDKKNLPKKFTYRRPLNILKCANKSTIT